MGKQKKLKALRKVIKAQAQREGMEKIAPEIIKHHYKRMKKVIFGKGGALA